MLRRARSFLSRFNPLEFLFSAILFGSLALATAALLIPSPVLAFTAAVAWFVSEYMLRKVGSFSVSLFRKAAFGFGARLLAVLLLVLGTVDSRVTGGEWTFYVVIALAIFALHSFTTLALTSVNAVIRDRVLTQNIGLAPREALPSYTVLVRKSEVLRSGPVVVVFSLSALLLPGDWGVAVASMAFMYQLLLLFLAVWSTNAAVMGKRAPLDVDALNRAVEQYAPTVVFYFSGDAASTYQVNVWLTSLERLQESGVRTLIVLRERVVFDRMSTTSLPVICVPSAEDLLALQFSTVRVSLYAANVGKNIHFLRLPHIKSVFVGHGDSDKNASFNPYSKVYSQIWVAGHAGAERYERADIGIDPGSIREVGRPQVQDLLEHAARPSREVTTILYAPTWEGWNELQNYCSVETIGLDLVRAVLSSERPMRLIYRPHPYIGRRSDTAKAAHKEILRLIDESNRLGAQGTSIPDWVRGEPAHSALEDLRTIMQADVDYLEALPAQAHVVSQGNNSLSLWGAMKACDAMVSDISSVITDFLATDKLLGVANPRAQDVADFRREFPSSQGGIVLGSNPADIADFLNVAAGELEDPTRQDRRQSQLHLLGSLEYSSFTDAVQRLTDAANLRASRQSH
jgi:hypothetical protein